MALVGCVISWKLHNGPAKQVSPCVRIVPPRKQPQPRIGPPSYPNWPQEKTMPLQGLLTHRVFLPQGNTLQSAPTPIARNVKRYTVRAGYSPLRELRYTTHHVHVARSCKWLSTV